MAKKDEGNTRAVSGEDVAPEQRDAEGNPAAARDGESAISGATSALEEQVNRMSPGEEAERQAAEAYPRAKTVRTFDGHDEPEEARQGFASTHRARVGRVVVVHEDVVRGDELYKAGTQDLPLEVADEMIANGEAYEPAGKKRGR